MQRLATFFACGFFLFARPIRGMDDADIPSGPANDAVMASPAEVRETADWALAAFGESVPRERQPKVRVECRRQDHNVLRFGQSCMETPLRIGAKEFKHGLGTHANSVIAVALPPGSRTFKAQVGVDNNYDTQGRNGTVQFGVEIGGKEVVRTPTLKGGDQPRTLEVPLPKECRELILKVDSTPDGTAYDQSDWADAQIVLDDGTVAWLDAADQPFVEPALPFSFRYAKTFSSDLLKTWKRTAETKDEKDCTLLDVAWSDPKTGLRVSATVKLFKRYPAVDWVLWFENQGTQDTPILEDVQALDATLRTGLAKRAAVLHHLVGDVCGERSFLPLETSLEAGKTLALAPGGGRPSNGAFPFFNLQYGEEGLLTAIGWSGQWAASLARAEAGPTRLRAGMEKTHLLLHPGERIRSPRVLLMPWKGDRLAAHNRLRRLLLFHYVPQANGRPLRLPIAAQCFDRYSGSRPEWATEAGQIAASEFTAALGCDHHWFDAAWFADGFPNGVGNWYCRPKEFPRGLKPVSDACHARGLKFILWFEPERVAAGSKLAKEHPEFVFGGSRGGLYKLSDPAARRFLTDLLSQRIAEFGLDVYRNDFNIDPLGFWRQNDAADRQGITEIRYVEGHYVMWDELRSCRPGLWIDNCASGGRRIDLETCTRSVPLWRSDTSCSPGHPDWNQTQTYGLGQYVPLFTACVWSPEAYDVRSAATAGLITQFDYLNEKFPMDEARAALAEVKQNQKYWYGDFYPLVPATISADGWAAYQFHRADLDAGLVLAFRRSQSNYPALAVSLRGIQPSKTYVVEFSDEARRKTQKTLSGRELAEDIELRVPKKAASLMVRYRAAK